MDIYQEILDLLQAEYMNGATYQEMASRKKISYSYLRGLMTGTNPPEKLSLDCLFKLFPKATINLHGGAAAVNASGTNGNVVGVNNGMIGGDWIHVALQKILETKELTSDEKVKVMKVLEK